MRLLLELRDLDYCQQTFYTSPAFHQIEQLNPLRIYTNLHQVSTSIGVF